MSNYYMEQIIKFPQDWKKVKGACIQQEGWIYADESKQIALYMRVGGQYRFTVRVVTPTGTITYMPHSVIGCSE